MRISSGFESKKGILAATSWALLVLAGCSGEPLPEEDTSAPEELAELEGVADDGDGTAPDGDEPVAKAIFPAGHGCTASQRAIVTADEARAGQYLASIASKELSLMLSPTTTSTQVFANHFAPTTQEHWFYVFDTYRKINSSRASTSYVCRTASHADCTGMFGDARAVTTGSSSLVRLCPLYFEAQPRTRAQTIIHELSHQNRTSPSGVGTDDLSGASRFNAHMYGLYAPRCFEGTCYP